MLLTSWLSCWSLLCTLYRCLAASGVKFCLHGHPNRHTALLGLLQRDLDRCKSQHSVAAACLSRLMYRPSSFNVSASSLQSMVGRGLHACPGCATMCHFDETHSGTRHTLSNMEA